MRTPLSYRAFGAIKGMNYGDGTSLSTLYDSRLRPTKWDVSTVLGYNYSYNNTYFHETTGRVSYAQSIYDPTLDRSYEYDHVGRLAVSHSGTEARAHALDGQLWGTMDGPYSQGYDFDVWGNVTHKYGWGGEVQGGKPGQTSDINYTYTGNRRNGFSYDLSGNLTNDLGQTFTYDATGQQAMAAYGGYFLQQSYDGDGLRVKKIENGTTTYYLRSSVLGGQVVAEMNSSGVLGREYVYLGGQLLAVRAPDNGVLRTYWVHEDPITKSKRVTDKLGAVVSTIELDPWGAEVTNFSNNTAFQPRKFTSYERDGNGSDEAMFRRSNRWHSRFDQPDPYEGSYSLTNPQSFNRYAYVLGDPVNLTDPSGLVESWNFCPAMYSSCAGTGGGGYTGTPSDAGSYLMGGYNDLPGNIAGALRDHDQRVQNSRDAQAANNALQRFLASGGRDLKSLTALATLIFANPTLQFQDPRTGDATVDLMARYLYAEAGNNYDEMIAIAQVFVLRFEAGFGGVSTLQQAMSNASIADNGRGSAQWRATADVRRLGAAELAKFGNAINAAQFVYYQNPNYAASGGGILPGNDYFWFVSNARTPSNFIRGSTSFFNFDPQHPATRGADILTRVGWQP